MPRLRHSSRPIRPSARDFRRYVESVESRPRPLRIPDLSRPPGADIDADGFVTCQTCGARVDVMTADVVGEGYQCVRCTTLAAPPNAYVGMPRAGHLALAGAVLLVIAVVTWVLRLGDVPASGGYHEDMPLPVVAGIGAAGCFGIAWARWRNR